MVSKTSETTMENPSLQKVETDVGPQDHLQQITGFVDDATVTASTLPHMVKPEPEILSGVVEERQHTVIDILSRPTKVAEGTWDDTMVNDMVLENLIFPDAIFQNSENVVDKLNFFEYFRADVCVRILVNANTFQQGKLIAYFTPFQEFTGDRIVTTNFPSSYTTYPYVLLDASVGNAADLTIPYVSPYGAIELVKNYGTIGNTIIRVLNSLKSGSVSYTVYAWFKNISITMPSGVPQQQSVDLFLNRLQRLMQDNKHRKKVRDMIKFEAQVAGEAEQKSGGIISSTLHTVSDIGTALSSVPLLAPVASPVSWISKSLANIADYFGWSKTNDLTVLNKYINLPGYGYTQASNVDAGVVLGMSQENSLEQRGDIFGSNVDEMDINWICAHKNLVTRFGMTVDDVPDTILVNYPVTPAWCTFAGDVFQPTAMAFVASMFKFWRGSLKYKIQAVKTAYHSGRVRITYRPAAPATALYQDMAYNWVLDLRTSSELEFTIPFNHITEWIEVFLTDGTALDNAIMGTVTITVLNELRAPASVAQDIEFNIWISGAEDIQFAVPNMTEYIPTLTTASFEAQVLGGAQDKGFNDMSPTSEMFCMQKTVKEDPCKFSIGEIVKNLRYLTRRFGLVSRITPTEVSQSFSFPPYYFGDAFSPLDPPEFYFISPVDYISWLFKFFRGSRRYKFMFSGAVTAGGSQLACLDFGGARNTIQSVNTTDFNLAFNAPGAITHRTFNNVNPVLEVTAPFYSQTPVRPVLPTTQASLPETINMNVLYQLDLVSQSASDFVDVLSAAGDDFSFGWLVGPPLLFPRRSVAVIFFGSFTLAQEDNAMPQLVGSNATSLRRPGSYQILGSIPPGAMVFAQYDIQYSFPLTDCTLFVDSNFVVTLTMPEPQPPPPAESFDPATTLSLNQALGDVNIEALYTGIGPT